MPLARFVTPLLFALSLAAPADAQNAGQVARVQAGASCPGCNLFQAPLANASLKGRDFSHARLRQADVSAAVMTRARLAGADLRDLDAYGAVMTGVDLRGADLTNASLVGAYLQEADMEGSRLDGANLSGAEMSRTRGLTRAQLSRACGDASTTLPRGLAVPPCR